MESIKDILVYRDNLSAEEAERQIEKARDALMRYLEDGDLLAAGTVCKEYFGLESDYLNELL